MLTLDLYVLVLRCERWERIEMLRTQDKTTDVWQTQGSNSTNDNDSYLAEMFGGFSSKDDATQDPKTKIMQQLKILQIE